MNAFKVHFSQFGPMWFLAIFSLGRRETSTFLAFPGLLRPRTLTRFNILPGIVFLYFWHGINWPQLTVHGHGLFNNHLIQLILSGDCEFILIESFV